MDFLKCILTAVRKRAAAAAGDIPGSPPSLPRRDPRPRHGTARPGSAGGSGAVGGGSGWAGAAWGRRGLMKHLMCITAGRGETRTPPPQRARRFSSPAEDFPTHTHPPPPQQPPAPLQLPDKRQQPQRAAGGGGLRG